MTLVERLDDILTKAAANGIRIDHVAGQFDDDNRFIETLLIGFEYENEEYRNSWDVPCENPNQVEMMACLDALEDWVNDAIKEFNEA